MLIHKSSAPQLQELFPLAEVPDRLPRRRGKRLHRSAPYRWAESGLSGVRLRILRVGSEIYTTSAWLLEFFEAVTAARSQD